MEEARGFSQDQKGYHCIFPRMILTFLEKGEKNQQAVIRICLQDTEGEIYLNSETNPFIQMPLFSNFDLTMG